MSSAVPDRSLLVETSINPPSTVRNSSDAAALELLDAILNRKAVRSVYQPVVELDGGAIVGYESLARGPAGSQLEAPDLLFAAARRARRLSDLDRACQTAAIAGARSAELTAPWTLFVNIEPEAAQDAFRAATGSSRSPGAASAVDDVNGGLRVIVELTERALTNNPTQLLELVARIRSRGWGIALDDVGADRDSLALLPLLRPDVIKLDLRLIQARPSADIAEIVSAVNAEAERSGTAVLAEGVETEEHLAVALGLGATLGQGWLFGRPAPLPTLPSFGGTQISIATPADDVRHQSPFALGAAIAAPRNARKTLLIEVSKHLERQAMRSGEATVVLSTFQAADFFTPATRSRYTQLGRTAAFVGALGAGMPANPLPGVRGGVLQPFDPVIGEWDIAVVGPHFAAVLVARDLGDEGPDAQRRFEFVLSHNRELAIAVATTLISRISPQRRLPDLPFPPEQGRVRDVFARAPVDASARPAPNAIAAAPRQAALLSAVPGLLDRALSATRTGVAIADAQCAGMPLIYVNSGFETITGYSAEESLGRNCSFLQGAGTDPAAVAEMSDVLRKGGNLATRLLNYHFDGTPFWNQLELHPVHDESGLLTHYISVQDDVTARVEAEERVSYLAYHDHLTGLPNRSLLLDGIDRALDRGKLHGTMIALLFIDLNGFKNVNDQYGHPVGDAVLCRVADRVRGATRSNDMLARQSGDEFLLLLADLDPAEATAVAERVTEQIHAVLREPINLADLTASSDSITIGCSIGLSLAQSGTPKARELIQRADAAMYMQKQTKTAANPVVLAP